MGSLFRNKLVFSAVLFVFLLLCAVTVLSGISVSSNAHAGDDAYANSVRDMTLEEAKRRIQAQERLNEIPKNIWKQLLTKEQYRILWKHGTEKPFTGKLLDNKAEGVYVTAGCEIPVFSSKHKFKSGTGWPSFWDVYKEGNIILKEDRSWGMRRVEVLSKCGEHLGHVFEDGPKPTGLRYCINSVALKFVPAEGAED